jgi:hypothetical protein
VSNNYQLHQQNYGVIALKKVHILQQEGPRVDEENIFM